MAETDKLLKLVAAYNPQANMQRIQRAYDFAKKAHGEEKRLSGELYSTHPLAVAEKLAEIRLDEDTIVAALLHDVREDTDVQLQEIETKFGKDVAFLVEGVTKLGKLKYRGLTRYVESLRKMFIAMAQDIRVIIIKFADRTHNLETLQYLPKNKQQRVARESLEIYAPIASRLGMGAMKGDIEDLAFQYVFPKEYKHVSALLSERTPRLTASLKKTQKTLESELKKEEIAILSIHGRQKHSYSLYRKLLRPAYDQDINRIYDLIALRIVVKNVEDCYRTLGIVHKLWKPIQGRFKDYIAQPKPNGYRSLHTTVFGENNEPIEIQIRDEEMHELAEYGVAAHWHYDESGKPKRGNVKQRKFEWVDNLAKWKEEFKNDQEYLEALKLNVFQNQFFVFTPRGDVIELPEDSTPIDFAYRIHTGLGNTYTGARVNDQFVGYATKLKSGDVVEIITDKNRKRPSRDWLDVVKTPQAREAIKRGLRQHSLKDER
ncbi:MAG: RelA/SpoT family protein [Patescibacteria group bacterium]|jgi:GTP pyrophosphokinase